MNRLTLTVRRTVPAPPEQVYDLWLDAEHPGGPWFGLERVILVPRVDVPFFWSVVSEGRSWPHYGRFTALERPRRLAYTHVSEATNGVETLVEVTFEPAGLSTEVTLVHSNVPDDELGRQHEAGWTWMLNVLAQRLAGP